MTSYSEPKGRKIGWLDDSQHGRPLGRSPGGHGFSDPRPWELNRRGLALRAMDRAARARRRPPSPG